MKKRNQQPSIRLLLFSQWYQQLLCSSSLIKDDESEYRFRDLK